MDTDWNVKVKMESGRLTAMFPANVAQATVASAYCYLVVWPTPIISTYLFLSLLGHSKDIWKPLDMTASPPAPSGSTSQVWREVPSTRGTLGWHPYHHPLQVNLWVVWGSPCAHPPHLNALLCIIMGSFGWDGWWMVGQCSSQVFTILVVIFWLLMLIVHDFIPPYSCLISLPLN